MLATWLNDSSSVTGRMAYLHNRYSNILTLYKVYVIVKITSFELFNTTLKHGVFLTKY